MNIYKIASRIFSVREDQVDDVLKNDVCAREAVRLSRRGFFAAGGIMAATPFVPNKTYGFLFPPFSIEDWLRGIPLETWAKNREAWLFAALLFPGRGVPTIEQISALVGLTEKQSLDRLIEHVGGPLKHPLIGSHTDPF